MKTFIKNLAGTAIVFWPTFKLTYTRSFGNKTLKGKRERQMGSEEERKRVN